MSIQSLEARLYPSERVRDPLVRFRETLYANINPDSVVLDLGAGSGRSAYALRGRVREVVGVDSDERVLQNPLLDRGVRADASPLPFADASFDVVFCIYVLEHVEDPDRFVTEAARILRPGGIFIALTPNRFHYVALMASLTPTSFHKWLNGRRSREAADTFPTFYRMNTRRSLLRQFRGKFTCECIELFEVSPNYLKFSAPTFIAGAAYERFVNSCPAFAPFRVNILCTFRKEGTPSGDAR